MLRDVVRRRRRRWAQASLIHAASHFYHEKRVAWVSFSMHACDPVLIVMGLPLRPGMASILGNSAVTVALRTRPRAFPLAIITLRKSIHGFGFFSI